MAEILQNKNSATRFQILVEIAASGPNVQQRSIAAKVGVSPQAISDYIRQLTNDGLIDATGRSAYRVSVKGVSWMLKMLREVNDYAAEAARAVTNITTCAAIAESDLRAGQPIGLKMKDGMLYATRDVEQKARGTTVTRAKAGDDVGISDVQGLVELNRGRIVVLEVPVVQEGGSKKADTANLKSHLVEGRKVGAIGIEALVALRRAGIEPDYVFGVAEAAIEGARCGLSFLIVCSADAISGLIRRLQESGLSYEVALTPDRAKAQTRGR